MMSTEPRTLTNAASNGTTRHIAIVRLDHLGDILLCTPLARALAQAGCSVDFVVPAAIAPILHASPHISRVIASDTISTNLPQNWLALGRWLRTQKYDVVILPYGRPWQLLAASLMSGAPQRLAMWAGLPGRILLHHCLRSGLPDHPRHFTEIMLDLANALDVPAAGNQPEVFLTADERTIAARQLASRFPNSRRFVGIHPGCAGNTCNLPPAAYASLASLLVERFPDTAIVVTGTPAEHHLLSSWPDSLLTSQRVWNAVGELSLRSLAAVIGQLSLYCVPSTGPLHIASALDVPTLSAFCPLNVVSDAVWGSLSREAVALCPARSGCENFSRSCQQHCDFRGEVTANDLFNQASAVLSKDPAKQSPTSDAK